LALAERAEQDQQAMELPVEILLLAHIVRLLVAQVDKALLLFAMEQGEVVRLALLQLQIPAGLLYLFRSRQ
jgi:hypothetical protein